MNWDIAGLNTENIHEGPFLITSLRFSGQFQNGPFKSILESLFSSGSLLARVEISRAFTTAEEYFGRYNRACEVVNDSIRECGLNRNQTAGNALIQELIHSNVPLHVIMLHNFGDVQCQLHIYPLFQDSTDFAIYIEAPSNQLFSDMRSMLVHWNAFLRESISLVKASVPCFGVIAEEDYARSLQEITSKPIQLPLTNCFVGRCLAESIPSELKRLIVDSPLYEDLGDAGIFFSFVPNPFGEYTQSTKERVRCNTETARRILAGLKSFRHQEHR